MRALILRVATLLAAGALVTACTSTSGDDSNTSDTTASATASPRPSDIPVRDVPIVTVLQRVQQVAGLTFDIKLVLADETLDCTLSGLKSTMTGDDTNTVWYCDEGYVGIPAAITTAWSTTPAIAIWYYTARQGVRADPAYRVNVPRPACAAAYVVTQKLGFKHETDGEQLLKFVTDQRGSVEATFVNAGFTLARDGKPIGDCKTLGT